MKKIYFCILFILSVIEITYADTLLNLKTSGGSSYSMSSYDTTTGTETLLLNFTSPYGTCAGCSFVDEYNGKFYVGGAEGFAIYDVETNTVSLLSKPSTLLMRQNLWNGETIISTGTDAEDGSSTTVLGSLDISDSNGNTLIENKPDGSVHIGENSLVTIESGGRQQLYATDSSGSRIDINIPSGTNLLIDGEDVMGSIDSSIALGAAFSSLPTGAEGAGYTCGLGTGFHDSASAISGGCGFDFANYSFVDSMPELFQKASFNIGAASVVHGEGDDATLKAGITFKFGAPKPVREAKDNNLLLETKIDAVMAKNETIQTENDLLKAQIAEINAQLKALNMLAMN